MTSRHYPNEHERQPSFSRFGFRSRLQTIMEVDGSAANSPGGKERNKPRERGTKRPVSEMYGHAAHNSNNSHPNDLPATGKARRCLLDSACNRPGKRCVSNRITTTTPASPAPQQRIRVEVSPACPAELQRKNMRSAAQVPPSGGGIPKLAGTRNKCSVVIDDQRTTHKQLLKEHLQLQKSFALWRQLVEEAQSHKDNEELASWAEEKQGILKSTKALQGKVDELKEKLTEYREQNELLEFRILELDHCQNKQSPPCELEAGTMTSQTHPEIPFCTTGCSQSEDPCLRLFHQQVALYQDLDIKAEELLEELRHLSSLPGLNCGQRSALARSAVCVARCKGDVRTALSLVTSPNERAATGEEDGKPLLLQTTHGQNPVGNHLDWLDKLLLGGPRPSTLKNLEDEDAELSDQSLLQETSMTESEIGQALMSEWSTPLTESQHKMVEHQHSEDEGLGEDSSRRSTEPNSLISEESDTRALVLVVEDLRRKNDVLISEIRQAEVLVRALKVQADKVQDLECQLSKTERERSEYQEQILELEEAENDARLESQTLRGLVENLRQHEDDLEKSLSATRDRLEEYERRASVAGATAEELRAQIGYLEELVYKYEEHIEGLEKAEAELREKLVQTKRVCVDVEVQVEEVKDCSDASVQVDEEDHPQCTCSKKEDLLSRLQSLEEKDGVLREQLHQVDGINLKLWQKLHYLETDIGECKRQEGSWGPEQHHREAAARLEGLLGSGNGSSNDQMDVSCETEGEIGERVLVLECNERKLREQLLQLERINIDFERELEIRERLNRDKEMELSSWTKRESELRQEIQVLEMERSTLRQQTADLEAERTKLRESLEQLQEEYGRLKLSHCQETQDLHSRHQEAAKGLQDTRGPEEEEFQKVMRLSEEALQLKNEQQELRSQVAEMSLAFETELRALRACHELEEKRFHDEMVSLRCKDDKCCARVQLLATQRERLESDLSKREQQLEALEAEFQRKTVSLDEERRQVESDLQRKMKEMEESTSCAVMELKEKRMQLEQSLRVDMEDLRCKESSYKVRIGELERHVDCLRREVTCIAQGNETYETDEDVEYRRRIEELEKKEAAYVETLENADQIISQMELRYRDNIQRLESSERSLQERVKQLEASDAELRAALHNERRASDGWRNTDLLRELMEAESRENSLKEHADELETSHKAMLQKVRDLERNNQHMSEELREHEEASLTTGHLRKDLETLREEVSQLRRSESALKETLVHADALLAQRERDLASRVKEIEAEKQGSEEMVRQLREQVRTLQDQLDQSQLHHAASSGSQAASELNHEEISDLKLEICHLEKMIQKTDSNSGETKETQTETIFYCNSRSVTAPVSPASSVEDLSSYHTPEDHLPLLPLHMPQLMQGPEDMMREEELEDASRLGMEERMALEHCMKRAMAAMERDLQRKADQHHHHPHHQVFHHREEEDDEEEERVRMPPSPACSSTSGCESDCSSSGGSCRWPVSVPSRTGSKNREDPYGSDEDHQRAQTPERHTVTSKELPTLMKTRIIYPSITKIEVKEMPTLVTRHSEYTSDVNTPKSDGSLPEAPGDFCILRRVGRDSLLVGWTPPHEPQIQSYQIFVDGELQQNVRSPDRTKALLHKLDLTRPLTIAIRSMQTTSPSQEEGRQAAASEPALLTYEPTECQKQ